MKVVVRLMALSVLICIPSVSFAAPDSPTKALKRAESESLNLAVDVETRELIVVGESAERALLQEEFNADFGEAVLEEELNNLLGEDGGGAAQQATSGSGCILWSSPKCAPCRLVDPGVKNLCEVIDPWTEPGKSDPRKPASIPTVTDQDGNVIANGFQEINDWYNNLKKIVQQIFDAISHFLWLF